MDAPNNFHDGWKHVMVPNMSNSWPQIKKILWFLVVDVWWHIT